MTERYLALAQAASDSWDGVVLSASALLGLKSQLRAAKALIGFAGAMIAVGFAIASAWQLYLGLPARVETIEGAIKSMSQDLCVIRGAIEQIDPIRCLRDLP